MYQEMGDVSTVARIDDFPETGRNSAEETVKGSGIVFACHKDDFDIRVQFDEVGIEETGRRANDGIEVADQLVVVGLSVWTTFAAQTSSFHPQREVALVPLTCCMEVVDPEVKLLQRIADA